MVIEKQINSIIRKNAFKLVKLFDDVEASLKVDFNFKSAFFYEVNEDKFSKVLA